MSESVEATVAAAVPRSTRILPAIARALRGDKLAVFGLVYLTIVVIVAVVGPALAPYDQKEVVRDASGAVVVLAPPSWHHPFGTTALGHDVFSQMLHGTRPVLMVGFICSIIPTAIGFLAGLMAGYLRGGVDTVISRIVEIFYAIPSEPFAIVIVTLLRPTLTSVIIAISLNYWKRAARVVRNHVARLNESGFVKAAKVSGAGSWWIMIRHMGPLSLPLAFVYLPIQFSNAVLMESTLSFLGFGPPNLVSWGAIMRDGFNQGAVYNGWWWVVVPGIAITLTALSMFLVTRPLEVVVDPRLRSEEVRI